MTTADFLELTGMALGLWAAGFCMGLLITTFRKYADKI